MPFPYVRRILEYDVLVTHDEKPVKVDLQLWDISGDKRYRNCWPAIFKGVHGIVLVYNTNKRNHAEELDEW